VYTPDDRDRVRSALVARAQDDARIVGAALTGSTVRGEEDRWSDVDVFLGVDGDVGLDDVIGDWTEALYRDEGVLHHFDVRSGAAVYRVFLLPSGLQVDVAFTPAASFGPRGPSFRTLFGDPVALAPPDPPAFDEVAGLAWLGLLHAAKAIERSKRWEAAYWIASVRDHALALACLRLGLRTAYARDVDELPADVTAPYADTFVASTEEGELRRGLRMLTRCLLVELERSDAALAARLETPLVEATG
jgi:hypothetical protein